MSTARPTAGTAGAAGATGATGAAVRVLTADPVKRERYLADEDFAVGLRAVRAAAGGDLRGLQQRTGLVVFTPGCLASGQLARGIDLLQQAGCRVVHERVLAFDEATVRRVWRYQLGTFRPDRWRLILDLLLAGPSYLVLLHGPPGGDGRPASDRLKELKGPSDPVLGRPDQLRVRLGGMNKIINLVHSAEESCDVVRETAILLHPVELRAAWMAAARPASAAPRTPPAHQRPSSPVPGRWAAVSFAHVAILLRRRLLDLLAPWLPAGTAALARSRLDREMGLAEEVPPHRPLEALAAWRERFAGGRLAGTLAGAALAGAPPGDGHDQVQRYRRALLDAFEELERGLCGTGCDLARLRESCAQAGFPIDQWDWLVIATEEVTSSLRSE